MQSDYMTIFKDIFYDVKQDEEMYEAIQASCELIGSVIVKYGEILNEMKYIEPEDDGLVNMVIMLFVRKIMEHLDAINILVEKSSFSQAKIILRTLLETIVSLRFILKEDTEKRAAAYYLYHHYEEIDRMKNFDETTKVGQMYKDMLGEEEFKKVAGKCQKKKAAFERLIQSKSVFTDIENLRKVKLVQKRKKEPKKKPYVSWYEICSNIYNFKGMMKSLGWEKFYESLYGGMSMEVHAYNATIEMIPDADGLHLKVLRNALDGFELISMTGTFAISALKDIYVYLEDGEEEKAEFVEYYAEYLERRSLLEKQYKKLLGEGNI